MYNGASGKKWNNKKNEFLRLRGAPAVNEVRAGRGGAGPRAGAADAFKVQRIRADYLSGAI